MKSVQREMMGTWNQQEITAYTLTNEVGYCVSVMTYGATVLRYETPDAQGQFNSIILGSNRLEEYIGTAPKWGATIAPVAGRISGAAFELNGQCYALEPGVHGHTNHSGSTGCDGQVFSVVDVTDSCVTLSCHRSAGTGGFPGNVEIVVSFMLDEEGRLTITYDIDTDEDTLVNPTNHSYFNLSGNPQQPIDDLDVQVFAKSMMELDDESIPTGRRLVHIPAVEQLRKGTTFGALFALDETQFQQFGGVDHPFELEPDAKIAAIFYDPVSKRELTIQTDSPSLVMYTANGMDDATYLQGQKVGVHCGVALEAQTLPDAIHHDDFGNTILRKGEHYHRQTIYEARVKE